MKVRRVNRYSCEFCKKSGCSAYHMRRHEEHCTLNPNRVCGMCKMLEQEQPALSSLIALLPRPDEYKEHDPLCDVDFFGNKLDAALQEVFPKLRKLAANCPACIMAALRQAGIPVPCATTFSFTKESKEIWDDINISKESYYPPRW